MPSISFDPSAHDVVIAVHVSHLVKKSEQAKKTPM